MDILPNKTNESKKTIVYLGSSKHLSLQHSWILYSLPTLSQTNDRNSLVKNAIVYVEYPEDTEFESAKGWTGLRAVTTQGRPWSRTTGERSTRSVEENCMRGAPQNIHKVQYTVM